jgi:hypothetical protein
MDVAGAAGTDATAERQQFVEAGIANILHRGHARYRIDGTRLAISGSNDQLGHSLKLALLLESAVALQMGQDPDRSLDA